MPGAAKGVAKGIVGVFANPVSGFLEAMRCCGRGAGAGLPAGLSVASPAVRCASPTPGAPCSILKLSLCTAGGIEAGLWEALLLATAPFACLTLIPPSPPLPLPPHRSATAEGVEATFGKPKDRLLVAERRRPPRVVSGEGKLLPLMRNGSTKQVQAGSCAALLGWRDAGARSGGGRGLQCERGVA